MTHNRLKIYSPYQGNRLSFVLDFCFGTVYDAVWEFVETPSEADVVLGGQDFFLSPSIFSHEKIDVELACEFTKDGLRFREENKIDKLASIFYCLARIEEYGNDDIDSHQRYQAKYSVFYDHLQTPWVDVWCKQLVDSLGLNLKHKQAPKYSFSFDLDFGFKHLGKGFWRSIGGLVKCLLKLELGEFKKRINSFATNTDPFDRVYKFISANFPQSPCFVLTAPRSRYDRGLALNLNHFKRLQDKLPKNPIGLHPSYYAHDAAYAVGAEKFFLQQVFGEIDLLRFHFLRFHWPQAQKAILSEGFLHDYSMGYANAIGFRAQTAHRFNYYNLEKDEVSSLCIHPFAFMDASLSIYENLSEEDALAAITKMWQKVKETGGELMCLWHDHTMVENTNTRKLFDKVNQMFLNH